MKMKDVLDEKVRDISLDADKIKELMDLALRVIGELEKNKLTAYVGGSLAKGTVIVREEQDIDIFVVFRDEKDVAMLGKVLKKIKLPGELRVVHGSRDYFQILTSLAKIELIPTVASQSPDEAANVTDVSLSHVTYVVGMIKKEKGLADEIKLAKAFCSAQRFYGAESYIKGFSGYSLEVLVIHFGGFVGFLKGVVGARGVGPKKRRVVDSKKYFKNENQILFEVNSAKLESPLIVIDPTYKYRNVTAGLGDETFGLFLDVSKRFLKRPSLEFFDLQGVDLDSLRRFALRKKARLFEVDLRTNRQEGDIAGTKCKKFFDFFVSELGRNGQEVLMKDFDYSGEGKKARGYLVVKEKSVVGFKGPPVRMREAAIAFQKENKDAYVKRGVLWVKKDIRVEDVFEKANRVKSEMGAWGESFAILSE